MTKSPVEVSLICPVKPEITQVTDIIVIANPKCQPTKKIRMLKF